MAHRELSSHGWRNNSRQGRQGTANPEGVWEGGQGCPPRALRAHTHTRGWWTGGEDLAGRRFRQQSARTPDSL